MNKRNTNKVIKKEQQNMQMKRCSKLLVFLSIILPLSIVMLTFLDQEKQLILGLLGHKDVQLLQKVDKGIISLSNQIEQNKIRIKLKDNIDLSSSQRQNKKLLTRKYQKLMRQLEELQKSRLKYFSIENKSTVLNIQDNKYFVGSQVNDQLLTKTPISIDNNQMIQLIKDIQQLSKDQQQRQKNPIEVYDLLVYNIVLFNINNNQQAIDKQTKQTIQFLLTNYLKQQSYLSNVIYERESNSDDNQNAHNKKLMSNIVINIQSGHISQIQPNYQDKIVTLYHQQSQQLNINKQITTTINNNNLNNKNNKVSQYYIEMIMKQLYQTKKPKHCHYLSSHTTCKQHTIYLLYHSNQDIQEMIITKGQQNRENQKQQSGINCEYQHEKEMKYWTTEDHSMNLMILPINTNNKLSHVQKNTTQKLTKSQLNSFNLTKSQLNSLNLTQSQLNSINSQQLLTFTTTIEQMIYQSLKLSQLILLLYLDQQIGNSSLFKSITHHKIKQFTLLNQLYKQLNLLHTIKDILNNTLILYERVDSQRRQQIINILSNISQNLNNTISAKHQNQITYSMIINQLNQIDPFPTDYKLGALAPIAIILIYPLLIFISYLLH